MQQQITEWQNRPLDEVHPIVFVDSLRVAVRSDKGVLNKCIYTVLGVSISGRQEVLGLWTEETEGAHFWLRVLNYLWGPAAFGHDHTMLAGVASGMTTSGTRRASASMRSG